MGHTSRRERIKMSLLIFCLTSARQPRQYEHAHKKVVAEQPMRVTNEAKLATRKRILEVAREHFVAKGFDATMTRDIARDAKIAAGTLFNYFPTKEAIVETLVCEAHDAAAHKFSSAAKRDDSRSLEEDLFALIAMILRKLHPYRNYLHAVIDSVLSPMVAPQSDAKDSLRIAHLETVVEIGARHGVEHAFSTLALQMYWTLFTGILAFWARDRSPRQEDTLALLDQCLSMFVGWLTTRGEEDSNRTLRG
jgi:AcrR family transcriptional regulator